MAKLKAVIDSLDGLTDAQKDLYELDDDDGKYYLAVEEIDNHKSVKNLKTAHERKKQETLDLKKANKELKEKAEKLPDDFDRDAYEEFLASREENNQDDEDEEDDEDDDDKKKKKQKNQDREDESKNKDGAKMKRIYEKRIERQKDDYEKKLKSANERIQTLETQVSDLLIDDGLTRALVEAGVDKRYLKGAKVLLKGYAKVVEEEGKPVAVVETDDAGAVPLPEYVAGWVESEEGKPYVTPASGIGAGATRNTNGGGAREDNPWKTGNLTEQGKVTRENPSKAAQLKRAAGLQ